jgi:RimJ/RimL family protein N-acetyltransferase
MLLARAGAEEGAAHADLLAARYQSPNAATGRIVSQLGFRYAAAVPAKYGGRTVNLALLDLRVCQCAVGVNTQVPTPKEGSGCRGDASHHARASVRAPTPSVSAREAVGCRAPRPIERGGCPRRVHEAELLIRPLADTDLAALQFMFRRLGEDSRYQRFLGPKHRLGSADLDILMRISHWHREALIAWSPRPRPRIGVARYARREEFDLAEVAVTVVDEWPRRGVGAELVTALRDRALRAGIRRFAVTLFRDNRGALALVRRFGPAETTIRDGGVVELRGPWR